MNDLEQWINEEMSKSYIDHLERGVEEWLGRPLAPETPWTCRRGVWATDHTRSHPGDHYTP